MNLVGKIFTTVIFLMSIVFASFSLMTHAAHKNWRTEAYNFSKKVDEANKKNDELQKELVRVQDARADDKVRFETHIAKVDNEKKNADERIVKLEATNVGLDTDLRRLTAEVKMVNQNLEARLAEIDAVRGENQVAVTDRQKVYDTLVHTQDEAANAKAEVERLHNTLRDLAVINKQLKTIVEYAKIREADMVKDPPSGLEGEVTAVGSTGGVEISVGYDDGVRKGHKFSVIRPSTGKYVGDIEVIQVNNPNRAVCRPDKAMQRDQIQKGDHVYASLGKRRS